MLTGGMIVTILCMIVGSFIGDGLFSGVGLLLWSAEFLGIGITLLLQAILGHNLGPGAKTAGYIIGIVFIPMGAIPLLFGMRGWLSSAGEARVKHRQQTADATITRVDELQRFGPNTARVRINYSVQPPNGTSFEVSRETNAIVSRMPQRGDRARIAYDPRHPDRFEVVSSGVSTPAPTVARAPATPAASTSPSAVAVAAGLGGTTSDAVAGATLPWAAGLMGGMQAQPRDQVQQLKQLADLHDRGALTDTEFEVEKAKILAEP
jgi:hypothetical protein